MSQPLTYLSLGSNLGGRETNVLLALRLIEADGAGVVRARSGLYETAPVGVDNQRFFINAVAEIRPLHYPLDLLKRLKTIEKKLGRTGGHNRPREIDIDVVSFGSRILNTTDLTLPHPRYAERAFVLIPLREIAPDFVCPASGRTIGDMIDSLESGQAVFRVSGRDLITTTAP